MQKRLGPIYNLIKKSFNINCTGLENISPNKNYIFAMNHQSVIDIPVALSILVPIVNKELNLYLSSIYYYPIWPLSKTLKILKVNTRPNPSARGKRTNEKMLQKGVRLLKNGNSVLIFPEGIIEGGRDSTILQGKTGAVRLSILSGVPIIPIGIRGSNKVHPMHLETNNPLVIRRNLPIDISVGTEIAPLNLDITEVSEQNKRLLRNQTDFLMHQLSALSHLKFKSA